MKPASAVAPAARFIASQQRADGAIPWWPAGKLDPWDHVESAMALDVAGLHDAAAHAYAWLRAVQNADGSFFADYGPDADETRDTNLSTYVAVGVWHHYTCTGDRDFLAAMWPVVAGALHFAIDLQAEHGGVYWARAPHGEAWPDCLTAGSSSIRAALLCGERIAAALGHNAAGFTAARTRLERALQAEPHAFGVTLPDDEARFAMTWYYPALCGALPAAVSRARLDEGASIFLEEGKGCRCVSDRPWITIAESAELVLAMDACDRPDDARTVLDWQLAWQEPDGGFRTGTVEGYGPWPDDERPTWTAAAVILAVDALYDLSPATGLFRSFTTSTNAAEPPGESS